MSPPTTLLLQLLLIIFVFTECSASDPNNLGRRILHQQPFFPQSNNSSASPPAPPPPPPVPFTTAASPPSTTPFFPSIPSSPPPPPSDFASFPANISSLNVSKPHSSSSPKLIVLAVVLLFLAVLLSFFAVYFFIYKKRRQSGCFAKDGKATDHSSTSSSKQHSQQQSRNHGNSRRTNPDSNVNSRTSSEFLYLGTLVNNQNSRGYHSNDNNPRLIVNKNILNVHSSNASSHDASSRKWDSPDLNPLPPLSRNSNIPISTEVGSSCHTFVVSNNSNVSNTSSRYDAEEEFYSPRGSLGGGGDSVETRSSSRRDLNAVDNFDGKKFSSSSSSRSSSSSSSSDSPARSVSISISPPVSLSPIRPKSPELVEMDVLARPPLMQPQQLQPNFMAGLEFASDYDGASLSSLSSKRSALDSARTSNQSDGNVVVGLNAFQTRLDCDSKSSSFSSTEKNPVDCLSGLDGNVRSQAQMPQPRMSQLECDSKSSSCSSPGRDPVDSVRGSSADNGRSQGQLLKPVMIQLEDDGDSSFSFSPEREANESPMITDASDQIQNPKSQPQVLHPFMTQLESHSKLSFSLSPERNLTEPPRTSDASDYFVKSPSRIPSPDGKPLISLSPEGNHIELSRISDVPGHHVESVRSPSRISDPNQQHRQPIPPPPPLPPPFAAGRQWESHMPSPSPNATVPLGRPPALITPSRPFEVLSPSEISPLELPTPNCKTAEKSEDTTNCETLVAREETSNFDTPEKNADAFKHETLEKSETPKPKLKTLHWDKVKANSDREMVWDQLKCSSFKLNEEMIETLFVANNKSPNLKDVAGHPVFASPKQDINRVLDPKKSQNIAISLRALNVTIEEVHEALVEGNVELLGTELLESLQKMAPTKEEERKLKEHSDDSPFKLGPAERFLKAVLDIPYAFKRVDAMLYVANFDSEVEYLKKSFETLEAACEELRNSRMFLKLLEAVLKTGNRMNVGTNRGDAQAFKLDTLLKLVDVKGADGKTTLLHFVVQEIIKAEGTRLSAANQGLMSAFNEDAKCRKLGLQVVSGLSSDLSNVKKAAAMDSEVLSSEVAKLSRGIGHIREIMQLNKAKEPEEDCSKFSESMDKFVRTAEEEIFRIQAQESVALSLVKEITEYFHGNSAKEEAHPFRIFMVVRDFLSILDGVCKEVGTINERTMISSAHKFPVPVNPMLPATSPGMSATAKQQFSSPYNYDSSSP